MSQHGFEVVIYDLSEPTKFNPTKQSIIQSINQSSHQEHFECIFYVNVNLCHKKFKQFIGTRLVTSKFYYDRNKALFMDIDALWSIIPFGAWHCSPVQDRWNVLTDRSKYYAPCPVGWVEIHRHRHSYRWSGQVNLDDGQVDLQNQLSSWQLA